MPGNGSSKVDHEVMASNLTKEQEEHLKAAFAEEQE
jgi:uncharacterized membrane protein